MEEQDREQALLEKITILSHSYMLGNETAANYEEGIFDAIKEAGYRLPAGKAPLLTDYQIKVAYGELFNDYALMARLRLVAKAQYDADNELYGGKE